MNSNGSLSKQWVEMLMHAGIDAAMFILSFSAAVNLYFGDEWRMVLSNMWNYWPSMFFGAMIFPCVVYVSGLYSPQSARRGVLFRIAVLLLCFVATFAVMIGTFYVNFSSRIGRGVMLLSSALAFFSVLVHHFLLLRYMQNYWERVAFLVTNEFDEKEALRFQALKDPQFEFVGIITLPGYEPKEDLFHIGETSTLKCEDASAKADRLLCTNQSMESDEMVKFIAWMRYAGVPVVPLISLCEETHHFIPVELVTPAWLLNASGAPHMFYIRKMKRFFDLVVALVGLVLSLPLLFGAMLAVRLTSQGPIFYTQVRSGRFGRPFRVIKLRTMRTDAEAGGAVWAQKNDNRITPVGGFLRKYRIDEIPQLINVLKGEMSFVGPRPERPEFIAELSQKIPYFLERTMVQPGITGWAQVQYPYGDCLADARRKLEYDLYYMKNMSLLLDVLILLDTVRIVLCGGVKPKETNPLWRFEEAPAVTVPVET